MDVFLEYILFWDILFDRTKFFSYPLVGGAVDMYIQYPQQWIGYICIAAYSYSIYINKPEFGGILVDPSFVNHPKHVGFTPQTNCRAGPVTIDQSHPEAVKNLDLSPAKVAAFASPRSSLADSND